MKIRVILTLVFLLFWGNVKAVEVRSSGPWSAEKTVTFTVCEPEKVNVRLENNTLIQTLPSSSQSSGIVKRIEIFPVVKPVNDMVYCVVYLENISDETVPDVPNGWAGMLPRGGWFMELTPERKLLPTKSLSPGEKRILYFRILHEKHASGAWESPQPLLPNEKEGKENFEKCVHLKNRYEDRSETPLLLKWYACNSQEIPPGDAAYGFYVCDPSVGADENKLQKPSTVRDEIQLTRLIFEYLHAEEGEDVGNACDAVTDFVRERPFPQKIAMTHRLFRLEPTVFEASSDARANWEARNGYYPPDLPESWRERLLTLEEKLREIRKNALAE
ncbi:MAG: hypothetical protein Q4C70_01720 [Planctomycetia bacterium]|nr:hypothetical protein [Planctomycetia bacterium]